MAKFYQREVSPYIPLHLEEIASLTSHGFSQWINPRIRVFGRVTKVMETYQDTLLILSSLNFPASFSTNSKSADVIASSSSTRVNSNSLKIDLNLLSQEKISKICNLGNYVQVLGEINFKQRTMEASKIAIEDFNEEEEEEELIIQAHFVRDFNGIKNPKLYEISLEAMESAIPKNIKSKRTKLMNNEDDFAN